jgi:putative ABC transport system substrate-binding protein
MANAAVLFNADIPPAEIAMAELEAASRRLNLQVSPIAGRGRKELMDALAALAQRRPAGLLVFPDPLTFANQDAIVGLSLNHLIPALYGAKEFVEIGGLISYGPSYPGMFRRGAHFVDRIFKGDKPSDLPVEQPVRFELAINLKTAKALGLALSPMLVARADEVIE